MDKVSAVYAKALFELGQEKGNLATIHRELKEFQEVCSVNPHLTAVLSGAGINPNDRRAILVGVLDALGLSPVVKRLLGLFVGRGRMPGLASLVQELELQMERAEGIQSGTVRSAFELGADELALLSSVLGKRVGGRVRLVQEVDPNLLGGVVATVSGKTFDASLKTQLERFRNEIL